MGMSMPSRGERQPKISRGRWGSRNCMQGPHPTRYACAVGDDARARILERRAAFIVTAIATCVEACSRPASCLQVEHVEIRPDDAVAKPAPEAGPPPSPSPSTSTATEQDAGPMPVACLSFKPPHDAAPMPCLKAFDDVY